ncbi:MAG: ribose 1,5-bisphosphate isomerase [Candidatus Bathyarchaeia archaeon]
MRTLQKHFFETGSKQLLAIDNISFVVVCLNISKFLEKATSDIESMRVRGAGNIARHAVSAIRMVAKHSRAKDGKTLLVELEDAAKRLLSTRPTAVSLANGVRYVMHRVNMASMGSMDLERIRSVAVTAADEFIEESMKAVERIGEIGSRRIRDGDVLLTHCHSAAAVEVMRRAWMNGRRFSVYVTETRPRYQGRETATILSRLGIPITLIVDSAARYFMNDVDKVVVGADAIAANGAVVNKIGTSTIATLAHEARTQFMVASETYKFSPETVMGELVTVEERDATEVVSENFIRKYPKIRVRNPAFDVTPPEYVDLIVTERGVIPPQGAIMIIHELFGSIQPDELLKYQTYKITEDQQ